MVKRDREEELSAQATLPLSRRELRCHLGRLETIPGYLDSVANAGGNLRYLP